MRGWAGQNADSQTPMAEVKGCSEADLAKWYKAEFAPLSKRLIGQLSRLSSL